MHAAHEPPNVSRAHDANRASTASVLKSLLKSPNRKCKFAVRARRARIILGRSIAFSREIVIFSASFPKHMGRIIMKILFSPEVFCVARPAIDKMNFEDWFYANGFHSGPERGDDAPIDRLFVQVQDDAGEGEALVEIAGRHCYRSWARGRTQSDYIDNIIEVNHGSVLEHAQYSFIIQGVSRSLSHEMVRHRVGCAISQESQRYVSAEDINFVVPPLLSHINMGKDEWTPMMKDWVERCGQSLTNYKVVQADLIDYMSTRDPSTTAKKRVNEAARSVLPNAAETRLTWSANIRTLRHFFMMRGSPYADLEIRRLACNMLEVMKDEAPAFFKDMIIADGDYGVNTIEQI
jgi:thymidylate synthase (FAD)